MKSFIVFFAVLAVALGGRSKWSMRQVSDALENPITNESVKPVLEQALNAFMEAMFAGQSHQYMTISTAPVDLSVWSMNELAEALETPNTNPGLVPYLENALNHLMMAIFAGEAQTTSTVSIVIPEMDLSYWSLQELDYALSHPNNPAMVPYLEQGLNKLMESLFTGVQVSHIVLTVPVEIVLATPEVVDAPIVVDQPEAPEFPVILPEIVVTPEIVETPVAPAAPGSPLVQIILNINQNEQSAGIVPVAVSDNIDYNADPFENPRPVPGFIDNRPVPGFVDNRPIPEPEMGIMPLPLPIGNDIQAGNLLP